MVGTYRTRFKFPVNCTEVISPDVPPSPTSEISPQTPRSRGEDSRILER